MSKGEARFPRSNRRKPLIDYAGVNNRHHRAADHSAAKTK